MRTLVHLTCFTTTAPWKLGAADLARARAVGLPDETTLQVVLLSAYFGHLNRVADAVGIELDYPTDLTPPHAEPTTPPYRRPAPPEWPDADARPALELACRSGAAESLAAWRAHALLREAPLARDQRAVIAYAVAERLGDAATVRELAAPPSSPLAAALVEAADEVTLAPWRLGAATIARLRAAGLTDDVAVFDALATAAACTTFSRIQVALAALAAPSRV